MTKWSPRPRQRPSPLLRALPLHRPRIKERLPRVLEKEMKAFSLNWHRTLTAACGMILIAGTALAQAPAPEAAPGRPDVKTVGDWMVRCFPLQSPSPCDMFQEQDYQKTGQ